MNENGSCEYKNGRMTRKLHLLNIIALAEILQMVVSLEQQTSGGESSMRNEKDVTGRISVVRLIQSLVEQ